MRQRIPALLDQYLLLSIQTKSQFYSQKTGIFTDFAFPKCNDIDENKNSQAVKSNFILFFIFFIADKTFIN